MKIAQFGFLGFGSLFLAYAIFALFTDGSSLAASAMATACFAISNIARQDREIGRLRAELAAVRR